jgi:endonuclease I
MVSKHAEETTYGEVRYLFGFTDCEKASSSTLSLFYCGDNVSSSWNGNTMNREHCWPKSLTSGYGDEERCNADIMTLRPTNPSNNSARGNKPYGTASGSFFPNTFAGGKYDLRGDCARIVLYTYVRWGQTNLTSVIDSVDTLLSWNQIDPVDTWELARNDSVESITGTRNVFVDYPELAFILFGRSVPAGLVTPSAA